MTFNSSDWNASSDEEDFGQSSIQSNHRKPQNYWENYHQSRKQKQKLKQNAAKYRDLQSFHKYQKYFTPHNRTQPSIITGGSITNIHHNPSPLHSSSIPSSKKSMHLYNLSKYQSQQTTSTQSNKSKKSLNSTIVSSPNANIHHLNIDLSNAHLPNITGNRSPVSPFLNTDIENESSFPYQTSYKKSKDSTPDIKRVTSTSSLQSLPSNYTIQQSPSISVLAHHFTQIGGESVCKQLSQTSALTSLMFSTPQKYSYFQEYRHLYFHHSVVSKKMELFVKQWRTKESDKRSMRTVAIILSLCLNIGVDPPDIVRTNPCASLQCWLDPPSLPASRALEEIANRLYIQYSNWKGKQKMKFQKCLDGTPEQLRKICQEMRLYAKDRRIIFHYNGHGVPRPTEHGEIWFFNNNYSEYLPVSILDIAQWLQTPSLIVLDCSAAGKIVTNFREFMAIKKNTKKTASVGNKTEWDDQLIDDLYKFDTLILAACGEAEILPMNPAFPADIFTSCLTSPIKMALKFFAHNSLLSWDNISFDTGDNADGTSSTSTSSAATVKNINISMDTIIDMIFDENISGKKENKNSVLGELYWIFLAVTDTIAWSVLPLKLFQKFFRLDYVCQSLFRNFLLAERILKSMNRNPISYPPLPPTYNHSMWEAWDLTVDNTFLQLKEYLNLRQRRKAELRLQHEIEQQNIDTLSQLSDTNNVRHFLLSALGTPVVSPAVSHHNSSVILLGRDEDEEKREYENTDVKKDGHFVNNYYKENVPLNDKKDAVKNDVEYDSEVEPPLNWKLSSFFNDQLRAFELWMETGETQRKPLQLPIVLQALLHQKYRLKALILLSRYLDYGPWAVNYVLWVGIFPYFKMLLKKAASPTACKTLRYSLTFIWAKILAHDPSCRHDLITGKHYVFFVNELKKADEKQNDEQQILLCTFILAQITANQPTGQNALLSAACGGSSGLLNILQQQLTHTNVQIRIWSTLCIAKLWQNNSRVKDIGINCHLTDDIIRHLREDAPEERACSLYALGTFFAPQEFTAEQPFMSSSISNNGQSIELQMVAEECTINNDLKIGSELRKLCNDGSTLVRMELCFVLSALIYYQQNSFLECIACYNEINFRTRKLKREQYLLQKRMQQNQKNVRPNTRKKVSDILSYKKRFNSSVSGSKKNSTSGGYRLQLNEDYTSPLLAAAKKLTIKHKHSFSDNLSQMVNGDYKIEKTDSALLRAKTEESSSNHMPSLSIGSAEQSVSPHYVLSPRMSDITMLANPAIMVNDVMTNDFPEIDQDDYRVRKGVWEVILAFTNDPIAEISDNAKICKQHMSNKVLNKNDRARAASFTNYRTPNSDADMDLNASLDANKLGKKVKRHRTVKSNVFPISIESSANTKLPPNRIPPPVPANDRGSSWKVIRSPLFDWMTQFMVRPLTRDYKKPDPLYHELEAKTLPLIDPSLCFQNFFTKLVQQQNDELEQLATMDTKCDRFVTEDDAYATPIFHSLNASTSSDVSNTMSPAKLQRSRGSFSMQPTADAKLNHAHSNALALSYIRLAAGRSWNTRKYYMHAEKVKQIWNELLRMTDTPTFLDNQNKMSLLPLQSPPLHSAHLHNHFSPTSALLSPDNQLSIAHTTHDGRMTSLSLVSAAITDQSTPRIRTLSTDYANAHKIQIAYNNIQKKQPIVVKKNTLLQNILGSAKNRNKNEKQKKYNTEQSRSTSVSDLPQIKSSHSLPIPNIFKTNDTSNVDENTTSFPFECPPSPYTVGLTSPEKVILRKDVVHKYIKSGMKINNQIDRYDTGAKKVTVVVFHPFEDIFYAADNNGYIHVWNYTNTNPQKLPINKIDTYKTNLNKEFKSTDNDVHQININRSHHNSHHSSNNSSTNSSTNSSPRFHHSSNNRTLKITSMNIINEYHDSMLCVGTADGAVRLYRNTHIENCATPVTAFLAHPKIRNNYSSSSNDAKLLTYWNSQKGYLFAGGSHHTVRIWDCNCEKWIQNFIIQNPKQPKVMSMCGATSDPNVLVLGCNDGRIRCYDIRAAQSMQKEYELNFHLKHPHILRVCPHRNYFFVATHNEVVLFDLRGIGTVRSKHSGSGSGNSSLNVSFGSGGDGGIGGGSDNYKKDYGVKKHGLKRPINAFAAHEYAPVTACGSTQQFVEISSTIKNRTSFLNEICHHYGFLGARIGPVKCVEFHKYKIMLAVAGTDRYVSLYSSNQRLF